MPPTGNRMVEFERCTIGGVGISITSPNAMAEAIFERAAKQEKGFVVVSATHLFVETQDDPQLLSGVNQAMAVVPDGRPLYWLLRLKRHSSAQQVRGQALTLATLKFADKHQRSVGIYGGRPEMLKKLIAVIRRDFPSVNLTFSQPGSFSEQSDEELLQLSKQINAAAPDVLFVGLGCPRQEKWMIRQAAQVNAVMIGVGGALDMVAGDIRAAPRWMQQAGLEWFHRLLKEPGRLWRRYLVCNSRFMYYAALGLILGR